MAAMLKLQLLIKQHFTHVEYIQHVEKAAPEVVEHTFGSTRLTVPRL